MKIRSAALVYSDFPDDAVEDESGIIQFGGRGVAEAIAELFRRAGYDVTQPEHQEEHGWDFTVTFKRRPIWIQITNMGDPHMLLQSADVEAFTRFLGRNRRIYAEALTWLNDAFAADPRFHTIFWYEKKDLFSDGVPGSLKPVDETS
jgi:hypothetical protein